MIYPEKLLGMHGLPIPNYALGLYTLMFKSNRIGPPIGTPCFIKPEDYASHIKEKGQAIVVCFFPIPNMTGPLSRWVVSGKDVTLVEKSSFFERLIMVESDFYSPKKIFSDETIKDISNTGGLLIDMPAAATDKFFDELKEVRDECKVHSVLNMNKNLNYENENNNLHLVVLVNDVFYSIPTFGRRGKSSLSMLIMLIEEQENTKMSSSLRHISDVSIIFSNEKKSPFIIDGIDIIGRRNLDNNICETFKSFCKPEGKHQQAEFKPKLPPSKTFSGRLKKNKKNKEVEIANKEVEVEIARNFRKNKDVTFKVFHEIWNGNENEIQVEMDVVDKFVKQE